MPQSEGTEFAPKYVDNDGVEREGLPRGAYLRIRTADDFLWVTEQRSGGASVKLYGPFATADEQREFMRKVWRVAVPPGPKLDAVLSTVDNWVRFDEEDGEQR